MTYQADYGPLVIPTDVDMAVVRTLSDPVAGVVLQLGVIEDERGLGAQFLKRPVQGSYANTLDDDEFLDHTLPAIIVTTAQTTGEPQITADGIYVAAWRVVVSCITRGRTPAETRYQAALYGGAVKRCLVQNSDLRGFAGDLKWVGENVAPVRDTTDQGRFLAAAIEQFTVYVDQVVQEGAGPYIPNPGDPSGPYDPPTDPDEPVDPLSLVTAVTFDLIPKEE